MLHYTIDLALYNQHQYQVNIKFDNQQHAKLEVTLPAWLPGSYMIRDFAKHIGSLSVEKNGKAHDVISIDKQTWHIEDAIGEISISYRVYALDTSVRTAYLDSRRAFFNGSSVFLQITQFAEVNHKLSISNQGVDQNWRVATGLKRADGTDKYTFGDYYADNYAELIDCPVEIGQFAAAEFDVAGVPHHLIIAGMQFADLERVCLDLQKLCQHHLDLFGELPFTEYWFLTNVLPQGFGGLEHKNSTALLCSTFDFPSHNQKQQLSDGYQTFLSLCSHEYFHAWNVCRIKPQELIPYQLSREQYTNQLWAYEGITSYYDDFSLYRTGLIDFERYLTQLSKTYSRVHRGAGQQKQSLQESSFYAWNKFYQQGPDAINNIVSYYTKGSLVALWMDLTIRKHGAEQSLDDCMRALWQVYKNGMGTEQDTLLDIFESATNLAARNELQRLISTATVIDLSELFNAFGVNTDFVATDKLDALAPAENVSCYLGAIVKEHQQGLQVTAVLENSPAELAGITVNDILIAWDGLKLSASSYQQLIKHGTPDAQVVIHGFRFEQLLSYQVTLAEPLTNTVKLTLTDAEKAKLWQVIYN